MADNDDLNVGFDEEEEEEGKEEEKSGFSENIIKYLTYIGLFLGVVLISVVSAIVVNKFFGTAETAPGFQRGISAQAAPPKGVYPLKEFKLPLDKNEDESVMTIVQVNLALAYEKDNQQVLDDIIARKAQIEDKIQYVISSKKYDEINSAEKREKDLKRDLLYHLNNLMSEESILDVYFSNFVISRVPG